MVSKPILIGGVAALAALAYLSFSGTSHAAQGPLQPTPLPPEPLPPGPISPPTPYFPPHLPDDNITPPVVVVGDPAAIQFLPATLDAGIHAAAMVQAGEGAGCSFSASTLAFQRAYNADPTSQHSENVLGTSSSPVFSLNEDGKFGINTATAVWYVTGIQMPGLCGQVLR
jgi:hypothetical protein